MSNFPEQRVHDQILKRSDSFRSTARLSVDSDVDLSQSCTTCCGHLTHCTSPALRDLANSTTGDIKSHARDTIFDNSSVVRALSADRPHGLFVLLPYAEQGTPIAAVGRLPPTNKAPGKSTRVTLLSLQVIAPLLEIEPDHCIAWTMPLRLSLVAEWRKRYRLCAVCNQQEGGGDEKPEIMQSTSLNGQERTAARNHLATIILWGGPYANAIC